MGRRYYADPTADMAIAHLTKERKGKAQPKERKPTRAKNEKLLKKSS